MLCHWRTRLDNQAAIFEALFNEDSITIDRFKQRLGTIFGVDPGTIDSDVATVSFSQGDTLVVTFSRNQTDYLRVALFGGVGTNWMNSGNEARGYLKLHLDEWEIVD
jgi:hypothetical protein